MFEDGVALTTRDLEALVAALCRVDEDIDDAERIDQLTALERVKSAVAAAQVRVTAAFVESQAEVAGRWRERAAECSAAGDFEGWRAAREEAQRATFQPSDGTSSEPDSEPDSRSGSEAAHGARRRGRPRAIRRGGRSGISGQVALARRESPSRGAQHVSLALGLVHEMPHTLAALEKGLLSEWRAMIVARETAELDPAHRALVDLEVAGRLGARLGLLGDRELARQVRAVAYRVDPASVMARTAQAQSDRRVTIRPAPDTMAYVTALLPVAQAVATHAALTAAADAARALGDDRSKGQVMADELVMRVTGQRTACEVPVEVQLVMTDRALFAGDEVPAQLRGYGTVPAAWARHLLAAVDDEAPADRAPRATPPTDQAPTDRAPTDRAPTDRAPTDRAPTDRAPTDRAPTDRAPTDRAPTGPALRGRVAGDETPTEAGRARARVWLRRLYTDPTGSELVAMDSVRRTFDGGLRRYVIARDGAICRTPWCDAPVRHVDHVRDYADGGPTSAANGQGLCVGCNHTKQQPGWSASAGRSGSAGRRAPHAVVTTTPTGHRYLSEAPPLLPGYLRDVRGHFELYLAGRVIHAA